MTSLQPGWMSGNGRYTLVRLLGRSGMGMVWLAEDEQLRERVVLKFLPPEIGLNSAALEDLKRETARTRKLTHPNIVRIYDFFKGEHEAFISMEFVDGSDLGAVRLDQPNEVFAWNDLQPFVIQLCDALDYAHTEGVIHRDIKPANLMIDRKKRLKLADFGFSTQLSGTSADLPLRHARSGTMAYMSPAQLNGEVPSVADDLYAFGATLYELLTGQPPFNTGDIAHQIRNSNPLPMGDRLAERGVENNIPDSVNALVMACLAKDPSQRPQSVRLIVEGLKSPELKSGKTLRVEPVAAKQKSGDVTTKTISAAVQSPEADKPAAPLIIPPLENWPTSDQQTDATPPDNLIETREPSSHRSRVRLVIVGILCVAVGMGAMLGWSWLQNRSKAEADRRSAMAEEEEIDSPTQVNSLQPAEQLASQTNQLKSAPTRQSSNITNETADFFISGKEFVVKDFNEGERTYSNRPHVWQAVPKKLQGWLFTQVSFETRPEIRVRAKRNATLFIATAFLNSAKTSEMTIPGWQFEGSTFHYADRRRLLVFQKRLVTGQEIVVPQGGRFAVIALFPK